MSQLVAGNPQCPIARSLEHVGEWWSMLILRDALSGLTRFDQFQQSLGIAPTMLTRRLGSLVAAGLLERRRYQDRPARFEYIPTERGRDFQPVLIALIAWSNRHFAREGISMQLVHAATGQPAEPILVDRVTGRPITEQEFTFGAGPVANERMLGRIALIARTRAARLGEKTPADKPEPKVLAKAPTRKRRRA